ncbi:hypothetical protein HZA75_02590 [Candidatus Roizmanbacteria bacterium]|nr:hypothetical protein [Candidatus Roizmanbacteria bacterium]
MKEIFKYVKTDKIIKWSVQISIGILLIEIIYSTISFFFLPPLVPLFNQLPWGEERLGAKWGIFYPSLIVFLFLAGNLLLLNSLYEKMPLVARVLSVTTLLISILSFIFIVQTLHIIL